jgi:hypothetical protein
MTFLRGFRRRTLEETPALKALNSIQSAADSDDESFSYIPPLARRADSSDDDSLFGIPPLVSRYDSSSDKDSDSSAPTQPTCPPLSSSSSFSSAHSRLFGGDSSLSSESSYSVTHLGPPPAGSIMDFWDRPIPTSVLHDFPSQFEDARCQSFSLDYDSDESTLPYAGEDNDTYCAFNPVLLHPILSLSRVTVHTNIVGLDKPCSSATRMTTQQLIDTGGNFNMTNRLDSMVNVHRIKPFNIGMAAKEEKSTSQCTHKGDFPIPMLDGSIFYTPMYYNDKASDCILSPEFICAASDEMLVRWNQSGATDSNQGAVVFTDHSGAEVIKLQLDKRNGLYYSFIDTFGVNNKVCEPHLGQSPTTCIYFHTPEEESDDDLSLDFDEDIPTSPSPVIHLSEASISPVDEVTPKKLQIEADLWQARLGHCSDWQLKVLPLSADGLPPKFNPHPFAFYDHYQQARIRKRPATKGKHPSRALTKSQHWYMDFGFMRASQFDYSRPDKKEDRVVTSFDGYNAYLIVVDEFTKMAWVYLCVSKEPPLELINMHLDQFGSSTGYIRTARPMSTTISPYK